MILTDVPRTVPPGMSGVFRPGHGGPSYPGPRVLFFPIIPTATPPFLSTRLIQHEAEPFPRLPCFRTRSFRRTLPAEKTSISQDFRFRVLRLLVARLHRTLGSLTFHPQPPN